MTRDYKKEIIDILEAHGGCVTGFNWLQKMWKFPRTILAEQLREMENEHFIEIVIVNKQTKRYCLSGISFRKVFKFQDPEIKAVEKELKRTDLSEDELYFLIRNHIKLTYHDFIISTVMYLHAKYQYKNKLKTRFADSERKKKWEKIEEMVQLLPLEKVRLWNTFLKEPPKIISLDDYRKIDHIGL